MIAISMSSGSFVFFGTYSCVGKPPDSELAPLREPGLEGASRLGLSLKLDGGDLRFWGNEGLGPPRGDGLDELPTW